ncbi:MAG: Uncharacterized amino acid permease, GabP family, partial [uncultured Solirubrobacteraceae bacterium]
VIRVRRPRAEPAAHRGRGRAPSRHHATAPAGLRGRRRPRGRRLRAHRHRGGADGRRHLGGLRRRPRARDLHRLRLRRARHEVPPRGGGGALRQQGVPQAVRLVHGRLRGHGVGHHERGNPVTRVRRRLPVGVHQRADGAGGARLHRLRRARQLPRHRRVDQAEPRPHDDRGRRPRARRRHRRGRPRRAAGRHGARLRHQGGLVDLRDRARRRGARVLRPGRLRGLRERRGGDEGPPARLSLRALRRPARRRPHLLRRGRARLDGRPDRAARGERERRPARGGPDGAARRGREGLQRHRAVRAGQRGAHQHDHGLAAALRDEQRGHPAVRPRWGGLAPHAARGDRLHDAAGDDPHRHGRPERPRLHDGRPAPARVHDRERQRARAAPRSRAALALQGAVGHADHRDPGLDRAPDPDGGRHVHPRGGAHRARRAPLLPQPLPHRPERPAGHPAARGGGERRGVHRAAPAPGRAPALL